MLHRTRVVRIALGMPATFLLVDDQAAHAKLIKKKGKYHPDWTAPDNDNRHVAHESLVSSLRETGGEVLIIRA